MKLQDLDGQQLKDKVSQVLETRLGKNISFDRLNSNQTRTMLTKVRGLIREHRDTFKIYNSQKDPGYLRLIMLEQGLSSKLKEQTMMPANTGAGVAVNPAQAAAGEAAKNKMVAQQQRKQIQDQIKAKQAEIAQLQRSLSTANLAMAENKQRRARLLKENEIQQAQVVLAAQDMIDRIQKMTEDISEMQFKDLPALTDSIKNDMGVEQATQFQSQAAAALTQLLTSVQQGKTQMEAAQGTLTGQTLNVPGQDDMDDIAGSTDLETDLDIKTKGNLPDLPPVEDDEEEIDLKSLGRERR